MPAPDARNDNYSITEDQLLVGPANGFLNNDSDPDGDPLSITRIDGRPFSFGTPITLASGATLTVNADGSFQYNQNGRFTHLGAGQTANELFTYSISDGHRGTDTAAVCFTISGVDPRSLQRNHRHADHHRRGHRRGRGGARPPGRHRGHHRRRGPGY